MSNLLEGLNLAMFGMGSVFVFLTLLIFVTRLMSLLVFKLEGGLPAAEARVQPRAQAETGQDGEDRARLMAVITAAIRHHRSR